MRIFEIKHAVRELTPLRIMLTAPSTGGKTYSALRLAVGIQRIFPGDIVLVDTENRRALLYADDFSFEHLAFPAPHGPNDFQEIILFATQRNPSILILDSMSDEHEGEGGVLEYHASEVARLMREWKTSAGKVTGAAWQLPKQRRHTLIRELRKLNCHVIFCFRAGEKTDWGKAGGKKGADGTDKETVVFQGWMPIAGKEWIYEMTFALVFGPQGEGYPIVDPEQLTAAQRLTFKINKPFNAFFPKGQQITEELGESIARWSTQGKSLAMGWSEPAAIQAPKPTLEAQRGPDHSEPCPFCAANPPRCSMCGIELLWRKELVHSQYGLLQALWRCPQKCKDPKDKRKTTNVKALDWHAILHHQKQQTREPGQDDLELSNADVPI